MKNPIFTITTLALQAVFMSMFSYEVVESDVVLTNQICKQTPNYNLCMATLKSDPASAKADMTGLALIMVNAVNSRAKATRAQISRLLRSRSPDELKRSLSSCASNYDAVVSADVPEAIEALTKGDPKFAQNGMNDAGVEADSCERGFRGKSPLSQNNKAVKDLSAIASSIITHLL